jgi:hypothetical protein
LKDENIELIQRLETTTQKLMHMERAQQTAEQSHK